ncbi:ABC transporter ATP-binding protein [Ketogulonicigenium vulgare]|uniref:ABC transporter ATP-binding protein n=1 Tax=Ketogulonicigenium vulgare TaxID=92945 RepID=UPI0001E670FD|nr:ABC transporter ATP-binding protein [Ketogulonicigenium vulgare]ADO43724.1 ABC transporter related protein [Ketogulonicigenium vulgare Y25]ALJ82428.1 ABC transporter ATP-binding protein [Ketogulonicigenium vulgare]ANW35213.1 ABC transporter ATP-binding protein [Ketogulonicigenium vulgare]AOZ55756.1 ABC transporter [Ketogulonicigenium vulgare]
MDRPVSEQSSAGLVMENVSKSFLRPDGTETFALRDVNLRLADQEFIALVGPSGCGKTTMLRMANGLLAPDGGRVLLKGAPPNPGPDAGFVFQSFRLIPWETVLSNITFALMDMDMTKSERDARARHYLELVGLSRVAGNYPAQLSGGMRQRVALARALAVEPKILLMDEPFASLDAQTRELMQTELLSLWERRRALVMFVTHSVDEAVTLADRVVVMGAGRVLETVDIDLPRPREGEALRADPRYIELRTYLWSRIRELVLSDPASEFHGRQTGHLGHTA